MAGFQEPPICVGCGILVDPTRGDCASCQTAYAVPAPRALAQPGGGYWVAIRVGFACRACGYRGPLNHFEDGDGVVCVRCGVEQAFADAWRELVAFAHGVGDFGAPGPHGRFADPELPLPEPKPHAALGSGTPWVAGPSVEATVGNPLCRACNAPVVVVQRDRVLEVACAGCRERRSYERGPAKRFGVAGVVADEHEVGRREVGLRSNAGAMIITCPNCNAPLERATARDGGVTCGYCSAACRISTRTHAKVGHRDAPMRVWWLYFDTPSPERGRLLRRAREGLEYQAKQQRRADQQARAVHQDPEARAKFFGAPRVDKSPTVSGVVAAIVIALAVLGGVAAFVLLR